MDDSLGAETILHMERGAKSPGVLHERVTKLEDQLAQFEVKLGECSGSASGVKEALVSQTSQTNRIEEKLSSQLQVAQASIQACCARLAAMDEQLDSAMRTVASLTAEVNLKQATPAHAPSEDIEPVQAQFHDVLLQILGRLSALENPRLVPEAGCQVDSGHVDASSWQTMIKHIKSIEYEPQKSSCSFFHLLPLNISRPASKHIPTCMLSCWFWTHGSNLIPEAQMRSQDSNQLEVKLQTLTESLERLNSEARQTWMGKTF